MHHVVDQNSLSVLEVFNPQNFQNHEEKILANSVIYVSFNIKNYPH